MMQFRWKKMSLIIQMKKRRNGSLESLESYFNYFHFFLITQINPNIVID